MYKKLIRKFSSMRNIAKSIKVCMLLKSFDFTVVCICVWLLVYLQRGFLFFFFCVFFFFFKLVAFIDDFRA